MIFPPHLNIAKIFIVLDFSGRINAKYVKFYCYIVWLFSLRKNEGRSVNAGV